LTCIDRCNQRLVQAPLHNVRAYSRDMLGLERDRLSRAVHASLPISKLVKQRSDFLFSTASAASLPSSGGGFLLHLVSVVNTLFCVSLRSVCSLGLGGGRRVLLRLSPSVNTLFCVPLRSVCSLGLGGGRRVLIRRFPFVNTSFCVPLFSVSRRRSRRREAGFYAPVPSLSTAICHFVETFFAKRATRRLARVCILCHKDSEELA